MVRDLKKHSLALTLRKSGVSIRTIAKKLNISSSTASIWCKDIRLSVEQKQNLASKSHNTAMLRIFSAKRHQEKLERHKKILDSSKLEIQKLTRNEFLTAGIALYWAEGFKNLSEGRIGFCNSDPRIIKFMIMWFKEFLGVTSSDFVLRTEFNQEHETRLNEIQSYWSEITEIPESQFNKPFLQKSKLLRDYSKRGIYYGLLRIRVKKSLNKLIKIRGWIEGLSSAY